MKYPHYPAWLRSIYTEPMTGSGYPALDLPVHKINDGPGRWVIRGRDLLRLCERVPTAPQAEALVDLLNSLPALVAVLDCVRVVLETPKDRLPDLSALRWAMTTLDACRPAGS